MRKSLQRWWRCAAVATLAALMVSGCATRGEADGGEGDVTSRDGTFTNPLFPNGADPWLEYWDGNYYLTTTTWTAELVMRKSPTLAGLADATPVNIWSDTDPKRNANFWAFEFHRLDGPNGPRWYVMYTAGEDGTLDHQHLNVLESVGDDPMGPYQYKASIMPDQWNIDGTYLKHDGKLYLLYSQWQGDEQLNLITEMKNPWAIKEGSPKVVLTRPVLDWEISGRKVTEGAEILQRNGRTFLIYSASYCNTPDYKLGMMELVGENPMNRDHWKKFPEPVFERANGVYGPGHNGFFQSPDGSEDWIVYHGNSSVEHGCSATRSVRAQKFTWNEDGTPHFGEPVPEGQPVQRPSGENGPLVTRVQGQAHRIVNGTSGLCLAIASGPDDHRAHQLPCDKSDARWVLDPVTDGYFRIANLNQGKFLEVADCSEADNAAIRQAAWRNNSCQEWSLTVGDEGHTVITNRASGQSLGVAGCSISPNQAVVQQGSSSACQQWQIQPVGDVAILSEQSGRAMSVATNGNVEQWAWDYKEGQAWRFKPTDTGFFELSPSTAMDQCLAVTDEAVVPGANLEVDECGSKTSQWRLKFLEGGAVTLVNRYTTEVVDLANCGLADGTNLALGPDLESKCQRFHLRATQ